MKVLIVTIVWAAFLFVLFGVSHALALTVAAIGFALMVAAVRRDVRRQMRR
jgi:hypothetical protein